MPSPTPLPTDPVTLRDACASDLPRLLELEALFPGDRLSPRQFRHHLHSPRARLRVAEAGGGIAGYALTFLRRGSAVARLYSIVVDPLARGVGVGVALLRDACVQAGEAGRDRLRLEVREDNAAAIGLYRREGFVPFGRHVAYYADGCDALRFERPFRQRAGDVSGVR